MGPSEINNDQNIASESLQTPGENSSVAESGGKTAGGQTKGVLDNDWFLSQIDEFAATGEVDIDTNQGFYLDTMSSYYGDDAVREKMIEAFGNDDPIMFEAYFNSVRNSYLQKTALAHNEAKGQAASPLDFTTEGGVDRSSLLMSASMDQMMYDDYRITSGFDTYESEFSHREGKTDRLIAADGSLVYADDFDTYSDMLDDDRFVNENGQAPIGFSYVGEQMGKDNKGGALVPYYDEYEMKSLVASRFDITDVTKIYRESHGWHSFVKSPINFLVSAIDNSILETAKNLGYIRYGEDAYNHPLLNTINNWSNQSQSLKLSQSDEAASLTSIEGALNLVLDVAMQIGTMKVIGGVGGKALSKLGVPAGQAQQYGAYISRGWMTTFAAADIGAQGRELGLTKRESAAAWFFGVSALWGVNSVFNWVEKSMIDHKFLVQGLIAENKKLLEGVARGPRTSEAIADASKSWVSGTKRFLKETATKVVEKSNQQGKWSQMLGASLNEAGQESFEFMAQEIVQSGSNMYRYYFDDNQYTGEGAKEFKGYNWIMDDNYFSDYFFPTLGMSALGGAAGGPIGKLMMGFDPTIGGKDSKVSDMMTYTLLTGNDKAFYEARDYLKRQLAFGDPALSVIKGDDGQYLTMQEAKEVDPAPIDQNTFNLSIIEDVWDFKMKALNVLGLKGAGVDNYANILSKAPEVAEMVTSYEIGNALKTNYDIVEKALNAGVNLNNIMSVKESVAVINEEYYKELEEAKKGDSSTEEAEKQADGTRKIAEEDAAKQLVVDEEGKITMEQATEVVTATQNVLDILNGKHAEEMFIKTIYGFDKSKPAKKRMFSKLDGTVGVESVDGIFTEMKIMSLTRDRNKAKHSKLQRDQKANDEMIDGPGTFAEKVRALKDTNGVIFISNEALRKLQEEFKDYDILKSAAIAQVNTLTPEQYATISKPYTTLLNSDQNTLEGQKLLRLYHASDTDGIESKEVNGEEVFSFDAEAVLQTIKDDLSIRLKKTTNIKQLNNITITSLGIGSPLSVKLSSNDILKEHVIEGARVVASQANPDSFEASDILLKSKFQEVGTWDGTDLSHMLANYDKSDDGTMTYSKDSELDTSAQALIAEAQSHYNKTIDKTTFQEFAKLQELDRRIGRRLELFNFMNTIDPLLGGFRQDMSEGQLTTFDNRREFDTDITKFNRTFNRAMYNPARKLELEGIKVKSKSQQEEWRKLEKMNNSYSKADPAYIVEYENIADKLTKVQETIHKEETSKVPNDGKIERLNKQAEKLFAELQRLKTSSILGYLQGIQQALRKELENSGKVITDDLAKKDKFKGFVNGFRQDTIDEVTALIGLLEPQDAQTLDDVIKANKEFEDLFKLGTINAKTDTDPVVEQALALIIEAKTKLHELYGGRIFEISNLLAVAAEADDDGSQIYLHKANALSLMHTLGFSYSDYISGYKSYVNLDGDKDAQATFDFPANHDQLVAGFQATSFLVNDTVGDSLTNFLKIYHRQPYTPQQIATFAPENTYAILGMLGSGKTTLVGNMALKIASDTLGAQGKKILTAAAVGEQVDKVKDELKKTGLKVYDESYLIGKNSGTKSLVQFLESKTSETLEDISTIFVDEATYMSDAGFNMAASKTALTPLPDDSSDFHAALKAINKNRADNNLPRLKALLMGDQHQNGAVTQDAKTKKPVSVSLLSNSLLPKTLYLREAERSNIQTLNQTVARINSIANLTIGMAKKRHLKAEYGYDSATGDLLGVPVIDSVAALATRQLDGVDKTTMEILIDKMRKDKKYTVGIATDTFETKEAMTTKVTAIASLLNDPEFKDRVKLYSHDNIQGREFDFTIVHADLNGFGMDFGSDFQTTIINGRKLATSVGRSRYGSVIINETEFKMTDKYQADQKRPSKKDVKDATNSLKTFQANSFKGINASDIAPAIPTTPATTPATTPTESNELVFSIDDTDTEFAEELGFVIPDNYDGNVPQHRKYILQKAIYHITGETLEPTVSESTLISEYNKILKSPLIAKVSTIAAIKNDLKDGNLESLTNLHQSLVKVYQHLKGIPEGDYTYSDIYFGNNIVVSTGNNGIGMEAVVKANGGDIQVALPVLYRLESKEEANTSYKYTGERGSLSTQNPMGILFNDNIIVNINSDDISDTVFFITPMNINSDTDNEEVYNDDQLDQIENTLRSKLGDILKTYPRWKESYPTKEAQIEVLESIVTGFENNVEDITEEHYKAAIVFLTDVYAYKPEINEDIDIDKFTASVEEMKDMSPTNNKEAVEYMKELDSKGVVSVYTSSFKSFAPNVQSGVPSLIHTGKVLTEAGYELAENSKDYLAISRSIMANSFGKGASEFVTYAYESPDPDNPFTTMMVAAKFQGKMYVLGHFNNTKDPGANLKQIQEVAAEAISDDELIIGVWGPREFYSMFNDTKALTSGGVVSSDSKKSIDDIKKELDKQGLYYSDKIKIIISGEHVGRAILFYSANPDDDFKNISLNEDPSLGMLSGSRGAILLDPGYMSLDEITTNLRAFNLGTPSYPALKVKSLGMNNISLNMSSAMASLVLEWANIYEADLLSQDIKSKLEALVSQANVNPWDQNTLTNLIKNQIGTPDGVSAETVNQAAMQSIMYMMDYRKWGGYYRADDGSMMESTPVVNSDGSTTVTSQFTYSTLSPILFAEGPGKGFPNGKIEFNFIGFMKGVKAAVKNMGLSVTSGGTVLQGVALEQAIMKSIGDMMTHTKEFKHGIRVLPVAVKREKTTAERKAMATKFATVSLAEDFMGDLNAPISKIAAPLLHLKATSKGVNIWDKPRFVLKGDPAITPTPVTPTKKDTTSEINGFMFNNNSVKANYTLGIQDSGIENGLNGLIDEGEIDDVVEMIEDTLAQLSSVTEANANKYIRALMVRIDKGEFATAIVPTTTPVVTIDNITESSLYSKLAREGREEIDAAVSSVKLLNNTTKLIFSEELLEKTKNAVEELRTGVITTVGSPELKKVFIRELDAIQDYLKASEIVTDPVEISKRVQEVLNSTETWNADYIESDLAEGDLMSLLYSYVTISPDLPNYDEVRSQIRDEVTRRTAVSEKVIFDYPFLSEEDLDEVFQIMAADTRGERTHATVVKAYNDQKQQFVTQLNESLAGTFTGFNPAVTNVTGIVASLKGAKDINMAISILESLPGNLFSMDPALAQTVDENNSLSYAMDKALINQAAATLTYLLDKDYIGKGFKREMRRMIDTVTAQLHLDLNGEFKPDVDVLDILKEFVGDKEGINYKDYFDNIIKNYLDFQDITVEDDLDLYYEEFGDKSLALRDKLQMAHKTIHGIKGIDNAYSNVLTMYQLLSAHGRQDIGLDFYQEEMNELLEGTMLNKIDPKNC